MLKRTRLCWISMLIIVLSLILIAVPAMAASYFASANISAPDNASVNQTVNVYVTVSSYPGGVWCFEIVDLDGSNGIVPISPSPKFENSKGVQYTWTSAPFASKTVKITVKFKHKGTYKLHVWGGASIFSHADAVKMITIK